MPSGHYLGGEAGPISGTLKRDNEGNYYYRDLLTDVGDNSIMIKFGSSGDLLWAKKYAISANVNRIYDFDLDSIGNIYAVSNSFQNNVSPNTETNGFIRINQVNGMIKQYWGCQNPYYDKFIPLGLKCISNNQILISGGYCAGIGCPSALVSVDSLAYGLCDFNPMNMDAMPLPINEVTFSFEFTTTYFTTSSEILETMPTTFYPELFCGPFYSGPNAGFTEEPFNDINELNSAEAISISPNPFSLTTKIFFMNEPINASMEIVDSYGKIIKTFEVSEREFILEKGDLKNGIYYLRTYSEGNSNVKKIVIQ